MRERVTQGKAGRVTGLWGIVVSGTVVDGGAGGRFTTLIVLPFFSALCPDSSLVPWIAPPLPILFLRSPFGMLDGDEEAKNKILQPQDL